MRRLIAGSPSSTLGTFLSAAGSSFAHYSTKRSEHFDPNQLVEFTRLMTIPEQGSTSPLISGLISKLTPYPHGPRVDSGQILQVGIEDIELTKKDKLGQLVVASNGEITVRYGKIGIAASEAVNPKDLLQNNLVIPSRSFGVLDVQKHVPFLIETKTNEEAIVIAACKLSRVPTHEENIQRYSLVKVADLPEDVAKRTSLKLQDKIFNDRKNEYFYEEITSKVYKPTEYNMSSGTLMNFESDDKKDDTTTASHYHPGERSLHIFTTKKPAGVTLNFCGIAENPDERKDCEKRVEFPPNSYLVLNFPPYTHHKFYGDFVCLSVHPREGTRLIEAVQAGTLPGGFLESATVFSNTDKTQKNDNWKMAMPANDYTSKHESESTVSKQVVENETLQDPETPSTALHQPKISRAKRALRTKN